MAARKTSVRKPATPRRPEKTGITLSNMLFGIVIGVAVLAIAGGLIGGYYWGKGVGYNKGYSAGDQAGYAKGEKAGYNRGFQEGENEGYNRGYSEGQKSGYDKGYQEGEKAGYDKGYTDGWNAAWRKGWYAGCSHCWWRCWYYPRPCWEWGPYYGMSQYMEAFGTPGEIERQYLPQVPMLEQPSENWIPEPPPPEK